MKRLKHKHGETGVMEGRPQPAPTRTGAGFSMLRWLVLFVLLIASSAATYAALTTYVWPAVPASVAGTWLVMEGEMRGAKLEFSRDGTFRAHVTLDGKPRVVEARVKLDDGTLWFISINPYTRKEETKSQKIVTLTENEMVLVDPAGNQSKLVRSN